MVMVPLWEHQEAQVKETQVILKRDRRSILCAPPGSGKTRMSKNIIARKLERPIGTNQNGRVLFSVHRRGLVDNASASMNGNPATDDPMIKHGIIMSGRKTEFNHPLQIGSIDSLVSWWCKPSEYKGYTFDLIIYDECHAHCSKLMTFLLHHDRQRELEKKVPAYVLGLSATPQGEGLADTFKSIVQGPQPKWLIDQGYLKSYRYYEATQGRLDLLKKGKIDFTIKSNAAAFSGLSGDLVRDWKKYGKGRSTVGFFTSQANAQEAREKLKAAGVRAEYVDCDTGDESRRVIFKMLDQGDIDYVTNVGIIERGTDIPRVACIQLCLAIGNIVRYRQMIGRGSRPHDEFDDCVVIDHANNVQNHGLFEDSIEWCLDRTVKVASDAELQPSIKCPRCHARYRGGRCKACGYEPTKEERKGQGLTFNGQELQEHKAKKQNAAEGPNYSDERVLVSAIFKGLYGKRNWKQVCIIAKRDAEKAGKKFRVPARFQIGGKDYRAIPFGHIDGTRKISDLFPDIVKAKS